MVYLYIFVMAFVTYLLRAVPLTVFRKKIENRFLCSFLYYVPYACLTALTIPAIFSATESVISAVAGNRCRSGISWKESVYRGGICVHHGISCGTASWTVTCKTGSCK